MNDRIEIESAHNTFVVVALGFWGKGKTLKEAKEKCRRLARGKVAKLVAFWGSQDITVSDAGNVTATHLLYLGEI